MKDNRKFRVLDVRDNVYCDLTREDVKFYIDTDGQLNRVITYPPCDLIDGTTHMFTKPLEEFFKPEFCTGRKDRHGKFIYQGDIVRIHFQSEYKLDNYEDLEVRYDENNCCWVLYDKIHNFYDDTALGEDEFDSKDYEVIGNINGGTYACSIS